MSPRWSPRTAANFRDLGGQPVLGGGRIRPGMLFRGASPQFLSDSDAIGLVEQADLRLVLDLRYASEAAAEGRGPLEAGPVRYLNIPIVGAGGDDIGLALLTGEDHILARYYVSFVQHSPVALVEVCRELGAPDSLPALLHCAAGKDRTGVVVAVLLSALGVPDEAIVADYARTSENMPQVMRHLGRAPTYAATIAVQDPDDEKAKSTPETMRAFLTWLARHHGSGRDLLLGAGLEPEVLDALRHRLVDRLAA